MIKNKNTNTSYERAIIFHADTVLLGKESIVWNLPSTKSLSEGVIRKINLDSLTLIELAHSEISDNNLFHGAQWTSIRNALNIIDQEQFSLLIKGLSIVRSDKYHRFCGACRQETIIINPSERHCPNCQMNYYPKISPAIIVLIHRQDEIIMSRSPHFPAGVYGLIAGFVEAGETLEAAVHREVMEEIGIKIKNLSYYGSQPWPFQDSLMIGFIAEYDSGDIVIDYTELEDAGWYRYDQLPGLPSSLKSIAIAMIKQFKPSS